MSKEKVYHVVLAHPIPAEQQRITQALEETGCFNVIHVTYDGLDCLREVVSVQPDLVILDMVLDKIDGLEVLRRLREFSLPKTKYLVTSNYTSYLNHFAALSGASHCILAPYSCEMLVERARQILTPPQVVLADRTIDALTTCVLAQLGAPDHLKGYPYAIECVRILVRDPDLVRRRRVTQELYHAIADTHGIPMYRVERVLRTLIEQVFDNNSAEVLARYFNRSSLQRSRLTNTAFLSGVANQVRERLDLEGQRSKQHLNDQGQTVRLN